MENGQLFRKKKQNPNNKEVFKIMNRLFIGALILLVSTNCFGAIGVNVSPNSWHVGTGGAGTWISPSTFTVENIGTESANVKIKATDTKVWTLSDTGAAGSNIFAMQSKEQTGTTWTPIKKTETDLVASLAVGTTFYINLQYQSPTSIEPITLTETQYSTITISVVSPVLGVWEIQTLDGSGGYVGKNTSLVLDSIGYPHISYYSEAYLTVKYTKWDGSKWVFYEVEKIGPVGPGVGAYETSISLDTFDSPHIVYAPTYGSPNYSDLKYAKFDGTKFTTSTVDAIGDVGRFCSIDIDQYNYPHISYYDSTNADLKYTKWNGTSWEIYTLDSGEARVGNHGSIAVDVNNNVHISYRDSTNGTLKYAKWNGTSWNFEVVDSPGSSGVSNTSIALDTNNYSHISYFDDTNDDLKYAKWTGSSWDVQTVDSAGGVGEYSSIALDTNNYPHISYFDVGNWDLKYAKWTGSGWSIQTIDISGGEYTSIDLDINNKPHISYHYKDPDKLYTELRYIKLK